MSCTRHAVLLLIIGAVSGALAAASFVEAENNVIADARGKKATVSRAMPHEHPFDVQSATLSQIPTKITL
jgi:hypothetical protein